MSTIKEQAEKQIQEEREKLQIKQIKERLEKRAKFLKEKEELDKKIKTIDDEIEKIEKEPLGTTIDLSAISSGTGTFLTDYTYPITISN